MAEAAPDIEDADHELYARCVDLLAVRGRARRMIGEIITAYLAAASLLEPRVGWRDEVWLRLLLIRGNLIGHWDADLLVWL